MRSRKRDASTRWSGALVTDREDTDPQDAAFGEMVELTEELGLYDLPPEIWTQIEEGRRHPERRTPYRR